MKLYHGSNQIINEIDLKQSHRGKDFGQGFYLSPDLQQAKDMALTTVEREGFGEPAVTTFVFDETVLSTNSELRVKLFSAYSEEWAMFIVANRTNRTDVPIHDYDIVCGPIANDRVGPQVRRFQNGWIDAQQLVEELKFVKPTFQYFFGTPKAIQLLNRISE